ncbi:MATE family efflux transporter [Erysipelotrichaceae bacterium MTC7]|nr:MATE family efflux transporter [Erysipelotrichaceae bacterium MTC7]
MKGLKRDITYVLVLSLPIIVENILQTLLGTADTYFAGQLNDVAIAGVGVTNLMMNVFIAFFTAISVGTSTIVSRYFGRKDYKNTNKAITQSLDIGIVLGLVVGLICFVFARPILHISGIEASVISYVLPYFYIVTVPAIFLCLQLILSSCFRSIKDTRTPMVATGISNVINIGLNALFIKMGMGVFGLGLATTIARFIGVLLLFVKLKGHDANIMFTFKEFKVHKNILTSILTVGIPAGAEKLIMRIGQLLYNGMIISIGMSAYVAHNVAGTIESYAYIPAMGFGLAVATLVGTSLGEHNPQKAMHLTHVSYGISVTIMLVIGVVFYIFAPQLAALFTPTLEVQHMVVDVLRLIAFFQPFSALVQIITNALQGAGDTKFPMYTTLVGIWGIRLGIGYLLAVYANLGLLGVWSAYALDITVRGIVLFIRFYRGKWKTIKVLSTSTT